MKAVVATFSLDYWTFIVAWNLELECNMNLLLCLLHLRQLLWIVL